jgi:hypothetical protein
MIVWQNQGAPRAPFFVNCNKIVTLFSLNNFVQMHINLQGKFQ